MRSDRATIVVVEKQFLSITNPVSAFIALGVQHATACTILSSVACPHVQYFSTLSHKRDDLKHKKAMELKTCVLIFAKTSVLRISHSLKTCERSDHKCV